MLTETEPVNKETLSANGGNELEFTGNWFVDAGIMGFVNLMEEVYGWDLYRTKAKLLEDKDKLYYHYFPFAYLFYHSKIRSFQKETGKLKKKYKEKKDKLNVLQKNGIEQQSKRAQNNMKKYENEIQKINEEIEKISRTFEKDKANFKMGSENTGYTIENFSLNKPGSHVNFWIYQTPKKTFKKSLEYLVSVLKQDYKQIDELKEEENSATFEKYPDSTINPFLPSQKQYSNLYYAKPLTQSEIKSSLNFDCPTYLLMLCFEHSFSQKFGKYFFFYTPNLELTYSINKKIKHEQNYKSIFHLTFAEIVDKMVEEEAKFSLENMYLISFKTINNQKLIGVEYIGIPKLQATIFLDDTIRNALNKKIKFRIIDKREEQYKQYSWLIGDFIQNKSLYAIIINHTSLFSKIKYLNTKAALYAIGVDTEIKAFGNKNDNFLFSDNFFTDYSDIVDKIKRNVRQMRAISQEITNVSFTKPEERKNLGFLLFCFLKKGNKQAFINAALKALANKPNKKISNYIFHNVLASPQWENYALAFVINLLGGNQNGP